MEGESENMSPYLIEPDFVDLFEQIEKVDIFANIEQPKLTFFAFGVFAFRSYLRYTLSSAKLTQNDMVRFTESIESEVFSKNKPQQLAEYFFYFKRKNNKPLEIKEVENLHARFYFMKDLLKFDFNMPLSEQSEIPRESINNFVTMAYGSFMGAIVLNMSNFLNFLNALVLCQEVTNQLPND